MVAFLQQRNLHKMKSRPFVDFIPTSLSARLKATATTGERPPLCAFVPLSLLKMRPKPPAKIDTRTMYVPAINCFLLSHFVCTCG